MKRRSADIFKTPAGRDPAGMTDQSQIRIREAHSAGMEFLLVDLELGMTFLDVGLTTGNPESARKSRENAWRAHDTVRHLLEALLPTRDEREAVEGKLAALRNELEK
jgi:hypothetical protein